MSALEDIGPGTMVEGIVPENSVQIVSVEWIGNQAVNVVYRELNGGVSETILWRDDEPRLGITKRGQTWSFDGDGSLFRLVTEANRIDLAHHFDPYLAIHSSRVDPLPHQISAVYNEMLPKQPLRFLLADDPGAGKTVMAGLLIKEFIARSVLERCLIVAPGSLVEQWQDELWEKFGLEFNILSREMVESSRSGNPFEDRNRLIVRLDMLARNEELQEKLGHASEWDLIVCDEAHRMAATWSGSEVKYTKRYRTGQLLGRLCRHFLLMTATPHNGKEEDFQLFMALLDDDRFEGRFRDGVQYAATEDLMRRLTKEELLRFDARPLFPERRAYTTKYELSPEESTLYSAVTDYVRTEMNRVQRFTETDGRKLNTVGFALQILQRRLASSPAAIYYSLMRRRERLEQELERVYLTEKSQNAISDNTSGAVGTDDDAWKNMEEFDQGEVDEIEEHIMTGVTASETVEQITLEVETLRNLERQALSVLHSGQDTKWAQLDRILDNPLMTDASGVRRKLIVFTEARDTLNYLVDRIRARLGSSEAVEAIHGGIRREDRRKIVERFMTDRGLLVLVANDAAGEGVNLQRGHLMVNYDLPWNPNRIEQRFGRIHRIGQTEVCHLWNLVAADTREGEVYARLLDKLETAREALGGRVYDVLGELFEDRALKDLLFEAIRYGEQEDVKTRLFRKVDGASDQTHLLQLLERRALTNDTLQASDVEALRSEMERAEAQRLQPCHIQSFFIEAFQHLGGRLKQREAGRWEIVLVPASLHEYSRQASSGETVQKRYERICFEKGKINQQPVATFVAPGHPLLESVIRNVKEKYDYLLRQGTVLVDETDTSEAISVVVLLEHSVQDARTTSTGTPHIVSEKLQFVAIGQDGSVSSAGIAPHLNLRPVRPDELKLISNKFSEEWLRHDFEQHANEFATTKLAREHFELVRARRLPEIEKVELEVRARLGKEINFWDMRAFEQKEKERTGERTRLNWQNAKKRAVELDDRLHRREALLKQEKFISSRPPRVRSGMLVIPRGYIDAAVRKQEDVSTPPDMSADPAARCEIELTAMDAVMKAECELGNQPVDVSAQKVGYDIESYDPNTKHYRFIEVKGRIAGARSVMITRQEIITSLHEPEKYILAIVEVNNGSSNAPRYVYGALDEHEPKFDQDAIQYNLKRLLERAEPPECPDQQ